MTIALPNDFFFATRDGAGYRLALENDSPLDADGWGLVAPFGEHPKTRLFRDENGQVRQQQFIQVMDNSAADSLVSGADSLFGKLPRAAVGVPIFKGHGDLNDADPAAIGTDSKKIKLGVVDKIRKSARGLEAHFSLDNDGADAVKSGSKFPSAFWYVMPNGKRGDAILAKPFKLISVALTKYPNISGVDALANAQEFFMRTTTERSLSNSTVGDDNPSAKAERASARAARSNDPNDHRKAALAHSEAEAAATDSATKEMHRAKCQYHIEKAQGNGDDETAIENTARNSEVRQLDYQEKFQRELENCNGSAIEADRRVRSWWHLVAHYVSQRTVGVEGITFRIGNQQYVYRDENSSDLRGREVLAWFDPECPELLGVTDLKGRDPRLIQRHSSPGLLAGYEDEGSEARKLYQEEIAKAAGHNAYPKARYKVLYCKFNPTWRQNRDVSMNTALVATTFENGRAANEQKQRQKTERTDKRFNKALKLGLKPATVRAGGELVDDGLEMMDRAEREEKEAQKTYVLDPHKTFKPKGGSQ